MKQLLPGQMKDARLAAALALALLSLQHAGLPRQRRHRAEARQRRLDELAHVVEDDPREVSRARELAGLLARGDTYAVADHSAEHAAFKRAHNRVFAALARRLDGPVFYLEGPDGGSTRALRAAGVATDRLHVANPHASTCAALRACRRSRGYVMIVAVVPASAPATNRVRMPPPSGSPIARASAAL